MDDAEIDMYTRVYARKFHYVYPFPIYDKDGNVIKEQETEDTDYKLIRSMIDDMFDHYSYRYQEKKDKMISTMTVYAKQSSDLSLRTLIAHCEIFPRILNEFSIVLQKELESRRK